MCRSEDTDPTPLDLQAGHEKAHRKGRQVADSRELTWVELTPAAPISAQITKFWGDLGRSRQKLCLAAKRPDRRSCDRKRQPTISRLVGTDVRQMSAFCGHLAYSPFIRYTVSILGEPAYPIDFASPIMPVRELVAHEKMLIEGESEPHRGHKSTPGNHQGPASRVWVSVRSSARRFPVWERSNCPDCWICTSAHRFSFRLRRGHFGRQRSPPCGRRLQSTRRSGCLRVRRGYTPMVETGQQVA